MASQGLISMARGDGFVQGAVSGFIGKISGPILQGIESDVTSSVIAGVFGGVASKATGGNFLQGALQAATVHLYNQRGEKAAEKAKVSSDPIENFLKAMAAEGRIAAGGLQIAAGKSLCLVGACPLGGALAIQGVGNMGGGISDYLAIFGVESNLNYTQQLYDYFFPGYGDELFLGVDVATGVLSLSAGFQRVPVQVEYNLGITGVKKIPAFMLDGTPIPAVINDFLQTGKATSDLRQRQ